MAGEPVPGDLPPDPAAGPAAAGAVASAGDAATPAPRTARRRPPPSRLERGVLDGAAGPEGLAWLGRPPEARASLLYRTVRVLARGLLYGVFRFRVRIDGREHVPAGGGFVVIAGAHRGWMDPFVVLEALPAEPRCWFLGSAPSTFSSPWRERFLHALGGLLPVWRGGVGIDPHVAAARAVLAGGAVMCQMPEGTVSGRPGVLGPFRAGAALIVLRTGAPVLPLALAGTEELYLGRRMAARVLPLTGARELLGDAWDGSPAEPGSREELALAHLLSDRLEAVIGPAVEALHPWTQDPPGHPRRLRERLTWLLMRRGRLDRA